MTSRSNSFTLSVSLFSCLRQTAQPEQDSCLSCSAAFCAGSWHTKHPQLRGRFASLRSAAVARTYSLVLSCASSLSRSIQALSWKHGQQLQSSPCPVGFLAFSKSFRNCSCSLLITPPLPLFCFSFEKAKSFCCSARFYVGVHLFV